MKALYLIIQCKLTYYCVKSALSLQQGGRGAERPLPWGDRGVPGGEVPVGCCPTVPLPLSPPSYREAEATNPYRFANLRFPPAGYHIPGAATQPWGPASSVRPQLRARASLPSASSRSRCENPGAFFFPSSSFFPDSSMDSPAVLLSRSHYTP